MQPPALLSRTGCHEPLVVVESEFRCARNAQYPRDFRVLPGKKRMQTIPLIVYSIGTLSNDILDILGYLKRIKINFPSLQTF